MRHMNTGNEALDRWNEMEMGHDKYLMLGANWSGWYVTPTFRHMIKCILFSFPQQKSLDDNTNV